MPGIKETFGASLGRLKIKGFRRVVALPHGKAADANEIIRQAQELVKSPHPPPVAMNENEVVNMENLINAQYTETYRRYLLEIGGASVDACIQPLERRKSDPHPVEVHVLYGSSDAGTYSLADNLACFKGRIREELTPIGCDGMGNQICLGIRGPEQGKVYYWHHEFEDTILVAESFDDFLHRLEPLDR